LGSKIETLDLGRRLYDYHKPSANLHNVSSQLTRVKGQHTNYGIEFLRKFDRSKFADIIVAPPAASLIFALIWMAIFLNHDGDPQAVMTTAFTVATYLVTTGKFRILYPVACSIIVASIGY
jgi:hypothetical protein